MRYRINKSGDIVVSGRGAEDNIQRACLRWFDMQYPKLEKCLYHIPNQTIDAKETAKKVGMGMRRGVPDLHLIIPNHGFHSLYMEVKTPDGVQSKEQKEFQLLAISLGHAYILVRSVDDFINAVQGHLHGLPCYKDLWGIPIPFPRG